MRGLMVTVVIIFIGGISTASVFAESKEVTSTVKRITVYPKLKGNRIDVKFTETTGCYETGTPGANGNNAWLKYEEPATKYMMGTLLYAKLTGKKVHFWVDSSSCTIQSLSPLK